MKIMYRMQKWSGEIHPIKVIKETTYFITVDYGTGRIKTEKKRDSRPNFATWKEAHNRLMDHRDFRVRVEREQLAAAIEDRKKTRAMKEPKP